MKKYYETLGLKSNASENDIDQAYKKLSTELNPKNNNNEEFFKIEYLKVVDAYNALSNKSKLGSSKVLPSNHNSDPQLPSKSEDDEFITVKISKKNLNKASDISKINIPKDKSFSRFFQYDNEYISGWTYFARTFLNIILSVFLIGIYLQSVTAYKRGNSLSSSATAPVWGAWGLLFIPGSMLLNYMPEGFIFGFILFRLPHLILWWSNGKKERYNAITSFKEESNK